MNNTYPDNKKKRLPVIIAAAAAVVILMIALAVLLSGCGGNTDRPDTATGQPSINKGDCPVKGELKVGNVVTFGTFEQDNDTSNCAEPVEWIVLAVKNGKALLLSKYGLDCQPFNKDHGSTTWENCSLRVWLNDDFINTAFSDAEKAWISLTSLVNPDNPEEGTSGGNDTADKVFILSLDEAVNTDYGFSSDYGTADKLRQCAPTEYAKNRNCLLDDNASSEYYGNCRWWLRTPSFDSDVIIDVAASGIIKVTGGFSIGGSMIAVRPAMWIDAE